MGPDRSEVLEQIERPAHLEQPVDLAMLGWDLGVFGRADCAEDDRVGGEDLLPCLVAHQRAVRPPCGDPERLLRDVHIETAVDEPVDDPAHLGDDLAPDTVTTEHQQLHRALLLGRPVDPRPEPCVALLELQQLIVMPERHPDVVEPFEQRVTPFGVDRERQRPAGRRDDDRRREIDAHPWFVGRLDLVDEARHLVSREHDRQDAVLEAVAERRCRRSSARSRSGTPNASSAQTACSRELPHPKFSPPTRIWAPAYRSSLRTNVGSGRPSGRYRHDSKRNWPECLGWVVDQAVDADDHVGVDVRPQAAATARPSTVVNGLIATRRACGRR